MILPLPRYESEKYDVHTRKNTDPFAKKRGSKTGCSQEMNNKIPAESVNYTRHP